MQSDDRKTVYRLNAIILVFFRVRRRHDFRREEGRRPTVAGRLQPRIRRGRVVRVVGEEWLLQTRIQNRINQVSIVLRSLNASCFTV